MEKTKETPDIVIGVDFGMTCTAVAYSYGPSWERPESIQQWDGLSVADSQNKVPTALVYGENSPTPVSWGFGCDYDSTFPIDDFKLELDPNYMCEHPDRAPVEEVRKWFKDYMTCLHAFLTKRFDDTFPRWRTQRVEWHFSVPTTWTSHSLKLDLQRILGDCGFGSDGHKHSWMISMAEAEAAAVYAAHQLYASGDVILVCDAGGGTTDVNVLRIDSKPGEPAKLTPLDHDEGKAIGSTNIDESLRKLAEMRLASIAAHLTQTPEKVAAKMIRSHGARFQSAKCGFFDDAVVQQSIYPLAIPDLKDSELADNPELGIQNGKLMLRREELQAFFDKEIDGIVSLVRKRLASLHKNHPGVQVTWLIRTGGLGSSPYVKHRLKEVFEVEKAANVPNAANMKIVQGGAPQTAISQGLVMARIQQIKFSQDIFALKCAQASYGIVVKEPFDSNRHSADECEVDPVLRELFATYQIDWIVKRGTPIGRDNGLKRYVHRVVKGGESEVLTATIVTSTAPVAQLPSSYKKAKDRGLQLETGCCINVTMPPSQIEKRRKSWYTRKSYRECIFHLRIEPEIAEIRFKLLTKDGKVCSSTDGNVNVVWGNSEQTAVTKTAMERLPTVELPVTEPAVAELPAEGQAQGMRLNRWIKSRTSGKA